MGSKIERAGLFEPSLSKFLGSLQSIMKEINSCNQKLQNFWAAKPKPISNLYIKLGVFLKRSSPIILLASSDNDKHAHMLMRQKIVNKDSSI